MLRPHRPVAIVLALVVLSACGGGAGGTEGSNSAAALASGPSAGNTASGQVLAPGGSPLAGVTLTAYKTNDHTSVSTTSDAAGRYAFSGLESGPQVVYEIWADKAGYGFVPSTSAPAAVVRRSDYNGLYRTVIRYASQPGAALTAADFTAYDGSTRIASLAATGQTASYAPGDDGAQRRGTSTAVARFSDNLDGTITDRLTGLVWLRDAGCLAATQWSGALQAANQLASGQCGLSDGSSAGQWRLPNVVELESLVDISRSAPALPAGHPFIGAAASYWSSTTYYGDVGSAWVLRLADGRFLNDLVANAKASATHATWAVRGTGSGGALRLMASGQYVSYAAGDDRAVRSGVRIPIRGSSTTATAR
ncbi:MAG: DUF1566 domain-containing protein [Steroidobacteraceae bacterium]